MFVFLNAKILGVFGSTVNYSLKDRGPGQNKIYRMRIRNISVGYSSSRRHIEFLLLLVDTKHFYWIFFNILCFYFYLSIQNISVGYSSRRQHIVSHFLLVDTKHVCWIFFKTTTDCVSTSTCRYKTFLLGYSSRQQHIVFLLLLVNTKHFCWIFFKMTTDCVSTSTC